MRKLLVLFLVLGLTSAANALLITVDEQEGDSFDVDLTSTITVVSEDASSWLGYIIVEEGGAGSLENAVILLQPIQRLVGAPVMNLLHQ